MLLGAAAAAAIVLFVTAHEAGHFIAAKAVGMKATQFFFGFGPKIWSTTKGETEYGFKWLPLGGYVRIVGMNPLEEVEPGDIGRTYREKKFWEKSVVVLAGVGMNFLIAFIFFYGIVMINGVAEPIPAVDEVVATAEVDGVTVTTPAADAGIHEGDVIIAVDGQSVETWDDMTTALEGAGAGPTTVVVDRDGQVVTLEVDLIVRDGTTRAFVGIQPVVEVSQPNPIEGIGLAGQQVWTGIQFTFEAMFNMLRPSSLAQYARVFIGDTDVDEEIRPVSPIGIVNIGSQMESLAGFFGILAIVNVILATINLLPLFPLDGGHFAVALYEKITGREADIRKLAPVAAAVVGLFLFLGFVAITLDILDPISLS